MRITKVKKRLRVRVRVRVSKNANSQQLINRSLNQTMDTFSVNTNENIPVLVISCTTIDDYAARIPPH